VRFDLADCLLESITDRAQRFRFDRIALIKRSRGHHGIRDLDEAADVPPIR
jgi:hypothetical protein